MYLEKIKKCTECGLCIEACPLSKDPRIMNCRHCLDAPCKEACKYNAFYESSPGVYGIDANLCVGCGDCAKACPYDAIVIENGIAKKCDLCLDCVRACPLQALKLVESEEEMQEKEEILGWKRIRKGKEIGMYWPSIQEARLIKDVLSIYSDAVKDLDVDIEEILDRVTEEDKIELEENQREEIIRLLKMEIGEFSVVSPLLEDENLEEIAVIGTDPIRVFHRKKGWLETNIAFTSMDKIIELANKMASSLDRRLTLQEPRINAVLPDGSRLHAVIPPVVKEPVITIRKFRKKPFSPREFIETKTISDEALALIWILMQVDMNVLIAGSTGSGKTTTLNGIMAFIPKQERVIAVEETPEVVLFHPHSVRLIVNKDRDIGMAELVEDTLRMRPDRVIVGEVRHVDEVKAWIDTTLAGQGKGSLATFHALSTQEAINRITSMGIPNTDLSALQLVLVQRRWTDYKTGQEVRKVTEISEIEWNEKVKIRKLYEYNFSRKKLVKKKGSKLFRRACQVLGLNRKTELKRRTKFLQGTDKDIFTAFDQISKFR